MIELPELDKSYAKEIYTKIKSDILKLNKKDGDFITLSELADKYKVSKTPVRDALVALEIEGYIMSLPRKGYLVKPITQKSIRESFQMRLILEKAAASLSIKMADEEELNSILQLAMSFPECVEEGQLSEFNALNDKFHMSIIRATHNSLLIESGASIMENLSRILRIDSYRVEFKNEKEEHISIAKALVERNVVKAEKLISDHISHLELRVYNNQRGI